MPNIKKYYNRIRKEFERYNPGKDFEIDDAIDYLAREYFPKVEDVEFARYAVIAGYGRGDGNVVSEIAKIYKENKDTWDKLFATDVIDKQSSGARYKWLWSNDLRLYFIGAFLIHACHAIGYIRRAKKF